VIQVDRREIQRSIRPVISAIDAGGELRLKGRDDPVASGGVDADRSVDEGFLGMGSRRGHGQRQPRRKRGGREMIAHCSLG